MCTLATAGFDTPDNDQRNMTAPKLSSLWIPMKYEVMILLYL